MIGPYKKLNIMHKAGIWFNRVPGNVKGVYRWVSMFEGKPVKDGAVYWHCVRNTWNYLQTLKPPKE